MGPGIVVADSDSYRLLAAENARLPLPRRHAIDQPDRPTAFVAIDPHGNLGFGRWVVRRLSKHEEIRPQLGNRQDMTVDAQLNANGGRVTVVFQFGSVHERET